jgi:hypothetical protein
MKRSALRTVELFVNQKVVSPLEFPIPEWWPILRLPDYGIGNLAIQEN